jgi:hypothetical protein
VGPPESRTTYPENQAGRRRRLARRPRLRRCLLKGCEQRFHPLRARQRYCSQRCREAARRWARRKAQLRYRATRAGKQKRNGQSQRYRERVRRRQPEEPGAVGEAARVIPKNFFSTTAATGLAATRDSLANDEVPYSASAHGLAGRRWSVSRSGSGAGKRPAT